MKRILELTLTVFITFGGYSWHSKHMDSGVPFNGNNRPIGIEYQAGDHTYGLFNFFNSYYRYSTALTYSQSWFKVGLVTGYPKNVPPALGYFCQKYDWEQLSIELGFLPNFFTPKPLHTGVALFKYVY